MSYSDVRHLLSPAVVHLPHWRAPVVLGGAPLRHVTRVITWSGDVTTALWRVCRYIESRRKRHWARVMQYSMLYLHPPAVYKTSICNYYVPPYVITVVVSKAMLQYVNCLSVQFVRCRHTGVAPLQTYLIGGSTVCPRTNATKQLYNYIARLACLLKGLFCFTSSLRCQWAYFCRC